MEESMKYSFFIDPDRDEEIIVYAHEKSELTERIERLVMSDEAPLIGYSERGTAVLDASVISCFFLEDGRVFALTGEGKYSLKLRLYQLEERFPDFLKINQSCIVNTAKIKRFDCSIGGSVMVVLEGGYRDYISRRQMKKVKERMGF